jgi:hypothetical protein
MARSKCGKCDGYVFEVVETVPGNSRYKVLFVQCSSCGTVVGVMDYFNIGTLIYNLAGKLKINLDS